MFIIKALFLIILIFLAFIGLAAIEFLVTVTCYDEDDIDNKESN